MGWAKGKAIFFRVTRAGRYQYVQIARSYRDGGQTKQQTLLSPGRLDALQASGQLDALLRSGLRLSERLVVLDAHAAGQTEAVRVRKIGPDLRQMIVGIASDGEGWPLCCEIWPGNTTDGKTLLPVVDRMKRRFRVRELCVLADRGMIRKKTLAELEAATPPIRYILGARMRRQKEVSETVLKSRGTWQEVHPQRTTSKDPAPLKVREVLVKGRRYIVCLNEEERRKDAHDREAIVAHVRQQLKQEGDKSLVGNKGYRRYLKVERQCHFAISKL